MAAEEGAGEQQVAGSAVDPKTDAFTDVQPGPDMTSSIQEQQASSAASSGDDEGLLTSRETRGEPWWDRS